MRSLVVLASLCALAACDGRVLEPGGGTGSTSPPGGEPPGTCVPGEATAGPAPLRRLTPSELARAVHDVFGVDVGPAALASLPDDDGTAWSVTDAHVLAYQRLAEATSSQVDAARLLDGCDPAGACFRDVVARVARLAYRRPAADALLAAEVDALVALAETFPAAERLAIVVETMVQSPWFLLRPEIGTASDDPGVRRLAGHELATRLSLLLLGTVPDEELLGAADGGELDTPEGLRARAERMLDDPRAQASVRAFGRRWLRIDAVAIGDFAHPLFDPALRDAAIGEIDRLLDDYLLGDRDALGLLTSEHTYVNQALASVYGATGTFGADLVPHTWPAGSDRRGLFGTAAFAMATSHPGRTSPTRRGQYARTVLLCDSLPPPPAGAEAEQQHSDDPNEEIAFRIDPSRTCSACHRAMDGIGLGLEQYDVVGRTRASYEAGFAIAGEGFVDGLEPSEFRGAAELGAAIALAPAVSQCFTAHVVEWGLGREVDALDACTVDSLTAGLDSSGRRFRELILDLVASDAFRSRIAP